LVIGAFFTVWTIQRTQEIGLLKALGASTGYLVRDALSPSVHHFNWRVCDRRYHWL
jgi:putative ABC transport system permease protein